MCKISGFPKILEQALEAGLVEFPSDVQDSFAPLTAYRLVTLRNDGVSIIAEDLCSQMELKQLYPNDRRYIDLNENDIENYSCSFFKNIKDLSNAMHLPRKNKAIISGEICSDNGVMNCKNSHINLWIYENEKEKMIDGFEVINDGSKQYSNV